MKESKGRFNKNAIASVILAASFVFSAPAMADLASEQAAVQEIFDATNGGSGIAVAVSGDSVTGLSLGVRGLAGDLPDVFAELPGLNQIDFRANQLTGKLPDSIGSLAALQKIEVQQNAFVGDATAALKPILDRGGDVDVRFNGLYSADGSLDGLISGFPTTQTLDAKVVDVGDVQKTSAVVTWNKVGFSEAGGYVVEFTDSDGNVVSKEVEGKNTLQTDVVGLTPGLTYAVVVRSFTNPHANNTNKVTSDGNLFDGREVTMIDNDTDVDGVGDILEGKNEEPATDTDGNGTPDFQDEDDDGDGINTADEADGDTDGDGVADYLDNDDDGDGILTADELPAAQDSDGDTVVNYLDADDDGDGIATADELPEDPAAGPQDTDGDGVVDFLDPDDDGDGTPTANELPIDKDENGNGVPDYLDNTIPVTQVAGDEGLDTVITSKGGGSVGFGFILLGLLGLSKKLVSRHSALKLSLLASILLFSINPVLADEEDTERKGRFYLGLSGGVTALEPDTSLTGGAVTLDDDQDVGGKLVFGYEFSNRWAFEGIYALLGESTLKPAGVVDYEAAGLALVFTPSGRAGSFSPLIKVGMDRIDNEGTNVNFRREDDQILYGALGFEKELSNAVGLRLEYDYFAEDAQMLSLGLVKKFKLKKTAPAVVVKQEPAKPAEVKVVEPKVVVKTIEVPAPSPVPAPIIKIPDSDGDGVSDVGDKCPNSPAGATIDNKGCAIFQGNLKGVNFESNSSRLTGTSRSILNTVAAELKKFPDLKIEVQAHTDSKGSASYNQKLSAERARGVISYLNAQGIRATRMAPVGYGERAPIASNDTKSGRAKNRRVVFVVR